MIIDRINGNNNFFEKMPTTSEYIQALEDERRKISVFQSELPLSLQLVTQAIEECKQKLLEKETQESGCPDQANSEKAVVLEEFMPLKRTYESDDDDDDKQKSKTNMKDIRNNDNKITSRKSDGLRSVQLWNQTPDPPPQETESKKRLSEVKRNGNGGAFQPFKRREKTVTLENGLEAPAADAASSKEEEKCGCSGGGGKCKKEEKQGQFGRKIRRSWSPELHERFIEALQQLGGSNVATPKQIRELMKVDGLSSDEVKSHLQKYRLHNKRLSPIHNKHLQHPQFVVVGGIWVPPPEYAAMDTTTILGEETRGAATPNEIYAPVAKLAAPTIEDAPSAFAKYRQQQHQLPPHDGNSSCGAVVDSQASSLSTDTTTTSSY